MWIVVHDKDAANRWLLLTACIAWWHGVEHLSIMWVYLASGTAGWPGLLAQGGALAGGLPISTVTLHFVYNLVETVPLGLAFLNQWWHACAEADVEVDGEAAAFWTRGIVAVLSLGVFAFTGYGIQARHHATAAARTLDEPLSLTGDGTQTTLPFTLQGGRYIVTWEARAATGARCRYESLLQAVERDFAQRLSGAVVHGEQALIGPTQAYWLPTGRYSLNVDSDCAWQVTIAR